MPENQFNLFEVDEELSRRIAAIDELINAQLNEILHHPEFKSLEATWRGLYHLVGQKELNFRVQIKILNAGKSELLKNFDRSDDIEESTIYQKIYSDIYQKGADTPYSLLIGAYEFDHLPKDLTVLEKISEIAAKAHAPFVASVSPQMFYWETFEEVDDTRDMSRHCRSTQYTRWNTFRESANARYVGLCMPHVLLREPYETDKNFVFRESNEKQDLLWGNAAFAFAGCIVRAFDEKDWFGSINGIESDGVVEDLSSQTEADLTRHLNHLSNLGFMSLVADWSGKLYFFDSQSTNKPEKYDTKGAMEFQRKWAKLENILAMSRFIVNMMSFRLDNFYKLESEEKLKRALTNWLDKYCHYNDDTPDEIKVKQPLREFYLEIQKTPNSSDEYKGVLYIRPIYLLDDTKIAMRAVIYFPALGI